MKEKKSDRSGAPVVLALLCGTFLLLVIPALFLHDRLQFMSDTITYLGAARSLVAGEGYTVDGAPVTIWPPGYSSVLALVMLAGINSTVGFKILNIIIAVGASVGFGMAFSRLVPKRNAWLAAATSAVFFPWIYYMHAILAEMLFALCIALFLLGGVNYLSTSSKKWFWLATCAAMVAPVVRMAGVALWLPWFWLAIHNWWTPTSQAASDCDGDVSVYPKANQNNWRVSITWQRFVGLLGVGLLVILPLALFLVRNALLTDHLTAYSLGTSPEYNLSVQKIGITAPTLWSKLWVNLRGYLHIFVIPDQVGIARVGSLPTVIHALCLMIWTAIGVGGVFLVRSLQGRFVIGTAVVYLCLLLFNSWYDIRYLLPVLPVLMLCLAGGAGVLSWPVERLLSARRLPGWCRDWSRLDARVGIILSALLLANILFLVFSSQSKKLRSHEYPAELQRLYQACTFIAGRPESGTILTASGGGFEALWSRRKVSSILGQVGRSGELKSVDIPSGVAFVILDETAFSPYRTTYLDPVIRSNEKKLRSVFRNGDTIVYLYQP